MGSASSSSSSSSSFRGSSSGRRSYSRSFDLPTDADRHDPAADRDRQLAGTMLPIFHADLRKNEPHDFVEIKLELEHDSVAVCSVDPNSDAEASHLHLHLEGGESEDAPTVLGRSLSATSRLCQKLNWFRSRSSRTSSDVEDRAVSSRDDRRTRAKLERTGSSARRALRGLQFISKTISGVAGDDDKLWNSVESRFETLAEGGFLSREDFGQCIGMVDSKEFALCMFDVLARRRKETMSTISKAALRDFWLQVTDRSFDARLQIFFEMADSNGDGRITRGEVQELIELSASTNKLVKVKEKAGEYASMIMEELDPENFGYIEIWQLEVLLLQKETYMSCSSRQLSMGGSNGWSPNPGPYKQKPLATLVRRVGSAWRRLILDGWQRAWILTTWMMVMAALFAWKFFQYRNRAAFQVMGYCVATAKGSAETLKFNMALVLLPVCRNTMTLIRSTTARFLIPFDDTINFHKIIAGGIVMGMVVHGGTHLFCDFSRIAHVTGDKFKLLESNFHKKPSYRELLLGVEGGTGLCMVVVMSVVFTLATRRFRRNTVRLPPPLSRLTGFNAFWYSHHLLCLVYVLLLVHGTFLFLADKWYHKTTWMYVSSPLLLYVAERALRTCRSKHYLVQLLKVSELPGNVLSIIMSKPQGFKYKSGQYIFLQCPMISSFEWHPFSITSAPGDGHLSVHIRVVGDWTQQLKENLGEDRKGEPKVHVDGPYGSPSQDYQNYEVLLLVGLGIGATPFISILRDLLHNTIDKESNAAPSRPDDSCRSKKKAGWTKTAHFYWVTREPGSFEWFKGVMDEVSQMDLKGQIELHNYLTSVYEEGDARSTLITLVQALNHAKSGIDILSGTRVRTHFGRPNWKEVLIKIASKHPSTTVGVFYCGTPSLAKELKGVCQELSHKTSTRFEFHKEYF